MDYTSFIIQLVVGGLTMGSIYALIAIGFVIIKNVTGVLNLAQGEFAMFGALIATSCIKVGMPYVLTIVVAILSTMVVGTIFERTCIFPARNSTSLTLIIITAGVSIVLRGIALLIWGTDPHSMPALDKGAPYQILHASVTRQSVWAVIICLIMLGLLYLFFNKTYWGISLRACVINRLAARVMGINPSKMSMFAVTVCAGLGALAGIIMTPMTGATYDMGMMLGMKAFVAAAIGGLSNAPAAIAGGFIIGIIEALSTGLISSGFTDAISFTFLLIVLIIMPNGIFKKASGKRV